MKLLLNIISFKVIILLASCLNSCNIFSGKSIETIVIEGKADTIKTLALKPIIKKESDTNITFILEATRLSRNEENEYIPSSEIFIVEVINKKGIPLWTSGENMNFLQVITNVEPVDIGKTYKYEMNWNGKNEKGEIISKRNFKVRMVIPAKPMTYFSEVDVDWGE